MSRRPFYEISQAAHLFRPESRPAGERDQPEEPVRQWCAFELIRAYGIAITEMEFERPVRVGSKTYRIDILVSRGGMPWLAVECKKPARAKPEEGIAQAISYADAQGIHAEFAVYTNGEHWLVRRRVQGRWVVVPDLPREVSSLAAEPITELLKAVTAATPLLYKLDETLEGAEAEKFLVTMQVFFCGPNLLTEDANLDLLAGTDNLLRVLALPGEHPQYRFGKLEAARQHFEAFCTKAGFGSRFPPFTGGEPLRHEIQQLRAAMLSMVEGTKGLPACDALVLKLDAALLEYGWLQSMPKQQHLQVGPSVHHALRDFLDYALAFHLNVSLPDPFDTISVRDLKSYCRSAWEEFGKDE
jgi:hypothetical protein